MLDIVSAMTDPELFEPWFEGDSWAGWRTILKAAFALPLTDTERAFFRQVAEREPPQRRVNELWVIVGRRGGKDSIASLIAAHAGALFDPEAGRLRPGERALCLCLAVDRDQAKIVLGYTRAYFDAIEPLAGMVERTTANGFELSNGVDIAVGTNNFRAVRGRPVLLAIFDEVAFWRDETSTSPDAETYKAIKPGMATIPGSMLIGISSPYRKAGLLFEKWRKHYGRDGDVLVIKAPSLALNPTLDKAIIDEALRDDPAAAAAEWLAEWRTDIESFVSSEVVDASIVRGRHELPFHPGLTYAAFVDPSGGAADSMTLAISHRDDVGSNAAVLDLIRERKAPFSPEDVVAEFAEALRAYGISRVVGDRYGGEWPAERFRAHGIEYDMADKPKSDLYRELLPMLNSGQVELLDHPRLVVQLCGLERRTARGGRDSIDHSPGAHDDVVNAAAGALVAIATRASRLTYGSIEASPRHAARPYA